MADRHRWAFKPRLRARAFGWRGSKTAIARLKDAVSEIKAVNRTDPVAAGEGAIVLMERLWPAFQEIDTSSGALGAAVNATLEAIIPILIAAPANPKLRAAWLERLYGAVQEDGVQYLYPAEQRWGEIAVYPELCRRLDLSCELPSHSTNHIDFLDRALGRHVHGAVVTIRAGNLAQRQDLLFTFPRMGHRMKSA